MELFKCDKCSKVVEVVEKGCPVLFCCGEEMKKMVPGEVDASKEKHVPVCEVKDGKIYVKVGEVAHPMTEDHYISLIILEADGIVYKKYLKPGDEPKAVFDYVENAKVFALCNLHGLWSAEVK